MTTPKIKRIFVIGMHRSGTSMISRVLNLMGSYCGSPDELLPPAPDNPGGFWERRDVKMINEDLLNANGFSWSKVSHFDLNQLSSESIDSFREKASGIIDHLDSFGSWVIKDPRNCLLLPLWRDFVEDMTMVFIHRNPLFIAQSLLVRNRYPELFSLALWEKYITTFLEQNEFDQTIFLNYDNLVEPSSGEIEKLYKRLFDASIPEQILIEIDQYINRNLDHSSRSSGEQHLVSDFQKELSAALSRQHLAEISAIYLEGDRGRLDNILASYEPQIILEADLKVSKGETESLKRTTADLKAKSALLGKELVIARDRFSKSERDLATSQKKNLEFLEAMRIIQEYKKALENSLALAESEKRENRIEYYQLKARLGESQHQNDSLTNNLRENEKEISSLRSTIQSLRSEVQVETRKRKMAEQSENDIRSSISFRIGWLLTRPVGIPYEIIHKHFKSHKVISVIAGIFQMGISHPLKLIKSITPANLIALKKALQNEYPDLILANARKKILPAHKKVKTKGQCDSDLDECENKLLTRINSIPLPELKYHPKVSIIITNHNGLDHLQRLSKYFSENTLYPNIELIFVDNASSDRSVEFINEKFPNSILLLNSQNESFSRSNNLGAKAATGELLLFMNNDIVPCRGWLTQLLCEYEQNSPEKVGSIGASLIYPKEHQFHPLKIQHSGISFDLSKDFIRAVNIGQGATPFDFPVKNEIAANTAACLLISKIRFFEVEGFDEDYIYGYEDVDLGLKLMSAGYINLCADNAFLFHYEFGTQNSSDAEAVRHRRLNNTSVFKRKWGKLVHEEYWKTLIHGPVNAFSQARLGVGLIVTDDDPHSKAGDTYTAWELKISLEKLGWHVVLIPRKDDKWMQIPAGLQVVINLLDNWDPTSINCENKSLIKIAWCRNWFDRWPKGAGFLHYDIILTSSKDSISIYSKITHAPIFYFPLATNAERFAQGKYDDALQSDYAFTGSYWNDDRQIIDFLNPEHLVGLRGSIYGYNWDRFEKFKTIYRGPLEYNRLSDVYASTKLLIDDANNATRTWGSVNSRIFDALGRGTMVISNGRKGSEDLFEGILPTFESESDLNQQIRNLIGNDELRQALVGRLQKMVLENHTYDHRARQFQEILSEYMDRKSIVIKVPSPNWKTVNEWGDYHMAKGLMKAFRSHNIRSRVQILPEWDYTTDIDSDYVLVLRGLSRYKPKKHHINIMWNISHPDKVDIEEYELYDHIFVSSIPYSDYLAKKISKPVTCLLQCTSPDVFYQSEDRVETDLLFVGNSRKVFRKIIRDLLPTKYALSIYGTNWEGLVDEEYIKGQHIDNADLLRYYSGAKIVLNDHWDSMREMGFISNRIFDALACGATVISDSALGLKELFGDQVLTYKTAEELRELVDEVMTRKVRINSQDRVEHIRKNHSLENRVKVMMKILEQINGPSMKSHIEVLKQNNMTRDILLPPQHLRFMKEDDQKFREIGKLNIKLMMDFGLAADSTVLDIGSGYGRLAYAMHEEFPDFRGSYLGLDILKPHVEWCARAFMNRALDNYQFEYQNIHNKRYNPAGTQRASEYRFRVPDASIDIVTLFSVFTHMYELDIVNYVGEIHRMLKQGGKCICTFFFYDEDRLQRINARDNGTITLKYQLNDHTRYFSKEDPLHVISYNRLFVENLFEGLGFRIIQCREGNWAGGESPHFQDQLIVSKF